MGFKIEFNWALKLKSNQGLDETNLKIGKIYDFSKKENRIYPLNIPIDLINQKWEVIAKVVILEFKIINANTQGKYKIIKIYNRKEKEILSNYWQETVQYVKGKKINNFFDIKVT